MTASAGSNGAISPTGGVTVTKGASKTYTITPASGYAVSQVTVDGVKQGALASYTFSNLSANHQITVAFVAKPAMPLSSPGFILGSKFFNLSSPGVWQDTGVNVLKGMNLEILAFELADAPSLAAFLQPRAPRAPRGTRLRLHARARLFGASHTER